MKFLRIVAGAFLAATCAFAGSFPDRIVSLAPSTTELLYGVGAFPRVVGVSQYCAYPPEVAKLPRVGGWENSSIEKIVALRPDLVVLTKPQEPFIGDRLRTFHLRYLAVPSESLSDVFSAIQMIGEETGNQKEASDLSHRTHASLDTIRAATQGLQRPSVLVCVSRTPGTLTDLYVATEGSYPVDLISIAGGRSIAVAAHTGYGKISKEAVMKLDPEVIIDFVHVSNSTLGEKAFEVWNDLPELRAVKQNRVYSVNDPFVLHPSQFVAHTAELFERLLHPELAGKATP